MPKKIEISVAQPCHENWDAMTGTEKGRHCAACNKDVFDFSNMSDQQLVAFFRKRKVGGETCGRFMDDQLNRHIDIPRKRLPYIKYFFQIALPTFLFSARLSAQEQPRQVMGKMIAQPIKNNNVWQYAAADTSHKTITGRIINENNEVIPYATIVLKNTTLGTTADNEGRFKLEIPSRQHEDRLLSITCAGYASIDLTIPKSNADKVDLGKMKMTEQHDHTMGIVVYRIDPPKKKLRDGEKISNKTTTAKPATSLRKTISDTLNHIFNIYPNPAMADNSVNLTCAVVTEGYHLVDWLDLDGRLVNQQRIWIDAEARVLNIKTPSVQPGEYLVRIRNLITGKAETEKVLIR